VGAGGRARKEWEEVVVMEGDDEAEKVGAVGAPCTGGRVGRGDRTAGAA
jgi:hypothetical protein